MGTAFVPSIPCIHQAPTGAAFKKGVKVGFFITCNFALLIFLGFFFFAIFFCWFLSWFKLSFKNFSLRTLACAGSCIHSQAEHPMSWFACTNWHSGWQGMRKSLWPQVCSHLPWTASNFWIWQLSGRFQSINSFCSSCSVLAGHYNLASVFACSRSTLSKAMITLQVERSKTIAVIVEAWQSLLCKG